MANHNQRESTDQPSDLGRDGADNSCDAPRPSAPATVAGALLLSGLFAAMTYASWRAWGDPFADFPKQLYMAWRIGEGDILYRDIRHFYGPLSQLFNGALFAAFGAGYTTLATANLIVAASLTALIYFTIARVMGAATALAAGAAFVLIHPFQQLGTNASNNFIGPYSHEATHGTLLLFVLVALAAERGHSTRLWILQGLTCGLILLTKPEFVLAGAAVSGTAMLVEWRRLRTDHASVRVVGAFSAGICLPLGACALYFLLIGASPVEVVEWTFGAVTPLWSAAAHLNPIYGQISGTSVLEQTLPLIGKTLLVIGTLAVTALGVDLLKRDGFRYVTGGLYLFAAALLLYAASAFAPPYDFAYALPFISTAGALTVIVIALREGFEDAGVRLGLMLAVAAVTLCIKIYLNATFWWMGFALLVPSTVLFVVLGMHLAHRAIRARRPRAFVVRWATAVIAGAMGLHVAIGSLLTHQAKTLALGDGDDRFFVFANTTECLLMHEMITRLKDQTEPNATFMTFPGGVLANYMLRRTNPVPFVANLGSRTWYEYSGGSSTIIAHLEKAPPDYFVYVHSPPPFPGPVYQVWGPHGFANALIDWVGKHYDEVDRIGPASQDFGELIYVLLKRRPG